MQHTYLLTLRPFLIFRAMLNPTSPISPQKLEKLRNACRLCVQAAREFVQVLDAACKNNPLVRALGFNGFYLETASFVIVYATTLNDPSLPCTSDMLQSLETAVECLKGLEVGFPLKTAAEAVARMRGLLIQLANGNEQQQKRQKFGPNQQQYGLQPHQQLQQQQVPSNTIAQPHLGVAAVAQPFAQLLPVYNPNLNVMDTNTVYDQTLARNTFDPAVIPFDDPFALMDDGSWDGGTGLNMDIDWGFEMGQEAFNQFLMMDVDTDGSEMGSGMGGQVEGDAGGMGIEGLVISPMK